MRVSDLRLFVEEWAFLLFQSTGIPIDMHFVTIFVEEDIFTRIIIITINIAPHTIYTPSSPLTSYSMATATITDDTITEDVPGRSYRGTITREALEDGGLTRSELSAILDNIFHTLVNRIDRYQVDDAKDIQSKDKVVRPLQLKWGNAPKLVKVHIKSIDYNVNRLLKLKVSGK